MPSATVPITGNNCAPIVLTMFSSAIFACSILAPVVLMAASNSFCIAPAVLVLSATRPKALRNVSRFSATTLISSAYSCPNSLVSAMARLCLSICSSLARKLVIACSGLSWMFCASSFAVIPRSASAFWNSLPCAGAVCSLVSSALMAVAATSGGLPKAMKASANAAACSAANPNCLALPPILSMAAVISASFAAVLLPSKLMASPKPRISSNVMPKTLLIFAAASAACSAVMPKATDICPASFVNSGNLSKAIPN